jgi:hypothetical protein
VHHTELRERPLRVLFVGNAEHDAGVAEQLRGLGFSVDVTAGSSAVRAALVRTDVAVVSGPLAAWSGIDRFPAHERHRVGWVLLSSGQTRGGAGWDAVVADQTPTVDFRDAIYSAHAKALVRLGLGAPAPS